ncbi:site-specific integrase [Vibrio bivalvicida]|uniref:Tyr recombinase domain-containing protein n=1 Tax=Vibrio bivalvicida TaxID=1276888 RepID=A0A177Y0S9_9VIBR|nr:site-specific integrase [Vibrio bivalvicida]OAJ94458.1 hypothetical protein APB76_09770 [Vibrio bivalvicida]
MSLNRTNESQPACFSNEQSLLIDKLSLPNEVMLFGSSEFDDKMIKTAPNVWRFRVSGRNHTINFNKLQNKHQIRLIKFVLSKYATSHISSTLPSIFLSLSGLFNWLRANDLAFDSSVIIELLDSGNYIKLVKNSRTFYDIVYMLRCLGVEDFPLIGESIEDKLALLPRPKVDTFSIYQNTDNVIADEYLTLILRGLWGLSVSIDKGIPVTEQELLSASILGLAYVTGSRPVQLDKLKVCDIKVDIQSSRDESRFSISIPYAKQGSLVDMMNRMDIALPYEVANIILTYTRMRGLRPNDKLFPVYASSSTSYNSLLNAQILKFAPVDYQKLVSEGKSARIKFTLTQFRHNVGHSLAMQGSSADDISFIMGHSSRVVARHYIMATSELARVRLRALGVNATWQNMLYLLAYGSFSDTKSWQGRKVAGVVGGALVTNVGGCDRSSSKCPFCELRCCYSCLYFRPFRDGNHEKVLKGIQKEIVLVVKLSDDIGDPRNPVISLLTKIKEDVLTVIKRLDLELNRGAL